MGTGWEPGLVEVYHKYKDREVAFVSVTSMTRGATENFVRSFAVPWPCAYRATSQTLARFGAFSRPFGPHFAKQ